MSIHDQVIALAEGWAIIIGGQLFGPYDSPEKARQMMKAHTVRQDKERDIIKALTVLSRVAVGDDYDESD